MTIFKLYFDKDAEEAWINDMSQKGWAFEKFFLGFYTFVPCKPGEYLYQIDLLESWAGDRDYFSNFMEELNIQVVSQWYRWVYLRKKASEGAFEMYTDPESKIRQYRRLMHFYIAGALLETWCLWLEFTAAIKLMAPTYWLFTLLVALMLLVFLRMIVKCNRKIQQLKNFPSR
ncbi:MAG TPA: DUF2812 domain-containing protein [Clostridiales bacterium]|nr:DUF2812 domain-containing protein [Clostridiales bacterium]